MGGNEGLSGDTLLVRGRGGWWGSGVSGTRLAHFVSSKRHKLDDGLTL